LFSGLESRISNPMNFIKDLFSHVVSGLLRNKLRSFLTMAGIAWGVASIVLIIAMGEGFKIGQRDRMKQLGDNLVIVFGGRTEKQEGGRRAGRYIMVNYDDVRDIRTECFRVRFVVGELQNRVRTVSPYYNGRFNAIGVESLYAKVRNIPIASGRFISDQDNSAAARVAVLGDTVRKQLFGARQAILGTSLSLNGLPFRIIGLMPPKTQNSSYNGLDSEKIYLPYTAMLRDMPPGNANFMRNEVSDLIYVPASITDWKRAKEQVLRILGRNHQFDPDDKGAVYIWDTVEDAQLVDGIFTSMTYFLGAIAIVTLTLGGVGVMNIMLVSVSERTQEIGLRKAVGATRGRIMVDYLVEGALLAVVSGVLGWAGSYGIAAIVNAFPKQEMFGGLPVSGVTTAIAFAALGVIAVISAIWPAWRAASLTPVQALSYER
jgi:putative ABC transport system permease protein